MKDGNLAITLQDDAVLKTQEETPGKGADKILLSRLKATWRSCTPWTAVMYVGTIQAGYMFA